MQLFKGIIAESNTEYYRLLTFVTHVVNVLLLVKVYFKLVTHFRV